MFKVNAKSLVILTLILSTFNLIKCDYKVSYLDTFFYKLDKELSSDQKKKIKECQDVDCFKRIIFFSDSSFKEHFRSVPHEIERAFDSLGIVKDRELVLLIAYHKRINNLEYSFVEIENSIKMGYEVAELEYVDWKKEFYGRIFRIAKTNFNKFIEGDTLYLMFPLSRDTDPPHVYFTEDLNTYNYSDTLFIEGILLEKRLQIDSLVWNNDVFFKLNVVFFSEPSYLIFGDSIRIGDVITISLMDYARPIKSCPQSERSLPKR